MPHFWRQEQKNPKWTWQELALKCKLKKDCTCLTTSWPLAKAWLTSASAMFSLSYFCSKFKIFLCLQLLSVCETESKIDLSIVSSKSNLHLHYNINHLKMFQEGDIFEEGLVHFPLLEGALENDFPKRGTVHRPQGAIGLSLRWNIAADVDDDQCIIMIKWYQSCIQIIEFPCAQGTPCKTSVLVTFLVTLWDWTYDFGTVGHPLYQCAMQSSYEWWSDVR